MLCNRTFFLTVVRENTLFQYTELTLVEPLWASDSGIVIPSSQQLGSDGRALGLCKTIWNYLHTPQFHVSSISRHPLGLFSHQTTLRNMATTWTVSGWLYLSLEAEFTSSSMILTWSLSLTSLLSKMMEFLTSRSLELSLAMRCLHSWPALDT